MLVISKMDYHFFAKFTVSGLSWCPISVCLLVNFTSLGIEVNGTEAVAGDRVRAVPAHRACKGDGLILVLAVVITRHGEKDQ